MANELRQYPLRLDLLLYKEIEKQAKEEDRSINYIINKLLEKQVKGENK